MAAESDLAQRKGAEVALKEKAVFFVKDFKGNGKYKESTKSRRGGQGGRLATLLIWRQRRHG